MTEIHQNAAVSGSGHAIQAGRDVHIHHGDGVRRTTGPATAGECPYPGLAAFSTAQAGWFFGRDALTAHLVDRLSERLTDGGALLVVGPSGAGKSSLLRAGLLAAITDRGALPAVGSRDWPQVVLTPTASPLTALTDALSAVPEPKVVVVDQLEELFTLCGDEPVRHEFLDRLTAFRATVVYGLRIDAYAHCLRHPALCDAAQNGQVVVGAMTEAELRQAVLCPAREAGLDLEPGLVDVLMRDLGVTEDSYEPGRLPLLAHALRALWRERHGHLLTVAGYRTTGGISDAVAATAETAYRRLEADDRHRARALFLRLVRIGAEPAGDGRRAVLCAELPGGGGVLDAFVMARLLTRDRDRVTITHEVLLRAWPRLRSWLDDGRADHLTRQQLEDAATAWSTGGQDPALLFRGSRLETARTLSARDLTPTGAAFYTASMRQDTRARRTRRAVIAVLAALTLVASVTAGTALYQRQAAQMALKQVIATHLVGEAQQLRATDTPANRDLAAQLDLIAWQFRQEGGTDDPVVETGLVIDASTELRVPPEARPERLDPSWIDHVFSPDGGTLALSTSGYTGGIIEFWSVTNWPEIRRLPGTIHSDRAVLTSTQFSPDGRLLAVSWNDGQVHLWSIRGTQPPRHVGSINDSGDRTKGTMGPGNADFNDLNDQFATFLDSSILVVGHHATNVDDVDISTTVLWDVSNPRAPAPMGSPLMANGQNAGLVAVDQGRRIIITSPSDWVAPIGSPEHKTLLWNAADARRPALAASLDVGIPERARNNISFLSNGYTLAMLNFREEDRAIELWDVADVSVPTKKARLPTIGDYTEDASIAYDAKREIIATSHFGDNAIRLWRASNPARVRSFGQPLAGHKGAINSMSYQPGGNLLVTIGKRYVNSYLEEEELESMVRLWNFDTAMNIQRLCDTTLPITDQQWRRYVPDLDYAPPCS